MNKEVRCHRPTIGGQKVPLKSWQVRVLDTCKELDNVQRELIALSGLEMKRTRIVRDGQIVKRGII